MSTKDSEDTKLQTDADDATKLVGDNPDTGDQKKDADNQQPAPQTDDKKGKQKTIKKIAAYTGAGVLLGAAASVFLDLDAAEIEEQLQPEGETPQDTAGEGPVGISDNMTFDEAFAAARQTLGPGAVFEWQGHVYATYTKDEWEALSDDEKSEFLSGVIVQEEQTDAQEEGADHPAEQPSEPKPETEVGAEQEPETKPETEPSPETGTEQDPETKPETETGTEQDPETKPEAGVPGADGINIVEVGGDNAEGGASEGGGIEVDPEGGASEGGGIEVDPEGGASGGEEITLEVIDVYHDEESGLNVGEVRIDGEDAILIDVDGDTVFDAVAMDLNENGVIDTDEIFNLPDSTLSVSDLGGFSDQAVDIDFPIDDPGVDIDEGPDYLAEL